MNTRAPQRVRHNFCWQRASTLGCTRSMITRSARLQYHPILLNSRHCLLWRSSSHHQDDIVSLRRPTSQRRRHPTLRDSFCAVAHGRRASQVQGYTGLAKWASLERRPSGGRGPRRRRARVILLTGNPARTEQCTLVYTRRLRHHLIVATTRCFPSQSSQPHTGHTAGRRGRMGASLDRA